MNNLGNATNIEVAPDGQMTANLSPQWNIWGPQGGYLATVALRAAGIATKRARPASINAHFVGAGSSGPVCIEVTTNRATRVATSVHVRIVQDDRLLLTASVWGVDDGLAGLQHQTSDVPAGVTGPHGLANMAERMANTDAEPPHPFWQNVEQRPTEWTEDWENRVAAEPRTHCWFRFVGRETFSDPWVDAGRSLVLLDVSAWGATIRAHPDPLEHYAPTIEVTARFIGSTSNDVWLLSAANAPSASNGLIAATGEIWTQDHRLVAVGGSTLLCRPAVRRPDGG